uniref:Uncharacterized protein n=1 Tax=Rhizophagus irregularis (strain DAOM 181602 / DAOM 197198 / MUCL 43194) TaxID=747089 RepID=U9U1E9_RHIID
MRDQLHFSPADHLAIFPAEVAEGKTLVFLTRVVLQNYEAVFTKSNLTSVKLFFYRVPESCNSYALGGWTLNSALV